MERTVKIQTQPEPHEVEGRKEGAYGPLPAHTPDV